VLIFLEIFKILFCEINFKVSKNILHKNFKHVKNFFEFENIFTKKKFDKKFSKQKVLYV
jgi:hypothetical protein